MEHPMVVGFGQECVPLESIWWALLFDAAVSGAAICCITSTTFDLETLHVRSREPQQDGMAVDSSLQCWQGGIGKPGRRPSNYIFLNDNFEGPPLQTETLCTGQSMPYNTVMGSTLIGSRCGNSRFCRAFDLKVCG